MSKQRILPTRLYPADLGSIMRKYGKWIQPYKNYNEKNSVYGDYDRSVKRMEVIFPLVEHPFHGITGLHAIEKYGEDGCVREYQYMWKIIIPKQGVQFNHISSWGNDPHNRPGTPEKFKMDTEPHHHHHVPGNRSFRTDNWDVHTLEQAFEFVIHYLETGPPYNASP